MRALIIKSTLKILTVIVLLSSYQLHAQTNLAQGKPISASSGNPSAFRAVDGNAGTRWESAHTVTTAWLQVDLGTNYVLTGTTINWEAANAANYEVQGSSNGSDWTTLASRTGGTYGTRTDTVSLSGSYRYLRIDATQKSVGNNWGYSIWEWKVNGSLAPQPQIVLFENFDNATFPTSLNIAGEGRQLATNPAETFGGQGKSLKYVYKPMAIGQSQYPSGGFSLASYNTNHAYIRFVAKMPKHTHGLKFLKVFGKRAAGSALNYANVTFGLDYTGISDGAGSMYVTSFGDGSNGRVANDTQNVLRFQGGTTSEDAGRSYGKQGFSVLTPQYRNFRAINWGSEWHKFEIYVKFNSGTTEENETNDGEFIVRIDDQVYLDAKGLFNRHYSNLPIDRIEILGYSQTGRVNGQNVATPEFEIWYDNVEISLHGWGNNPM